MLFDFLHQPVYTSFLPDEFVKEHYVVFTQVRENMSQGV